MTFQTMQVSVMAGSLGDIFWDLAPAIAYSAGFDIGCTIYVANPTSEEKEYALMARLSRDTTKISEEALPVYGQTWFKVEPGDFVVLKGAMRFNDSNAVLTVSLMEKETGTETDSVATTLIASTTSALPPSWPGTTGTTTDTWSSTMGMMLPMMMLFMFGMMMTSAFRPKEEPAPTVRVAEVPRKMLPTGRGE